MLSVHPVTDKTQWNELVDSWVGHPMQAWQWGEFKAQTGSWQAHRVEVRRNDAPIGGAQILVRSLPWPFKAIAYAPRGVMAADLTDFAEVADACADWAKITCRAISLKIDPPLESVDLSSSWVRGSRVLLERTAIVDLRPEADEIMKNFHSKKARSYIRRGERLGIEIQTATPNDIDTVIGLYHHTANRSNFALHSDEYYRKAYNLLEDLGQLTVTRSEGEILSFMWNITNRWGACELWTGTSDKGYKIRSNYLLKWGAILAAKQAGARQYDLNGLLNDGISSFKSKFQHEPTVFTGAWDHPNSSLYYAWEKALALYKKIRN